MRFIPIATITACSLLLAAPTLAWDADGSVAARAAELKARAAKAGPRGEARVKAELLAQETAPKWTSKTVWTAVSDGRMYLYAVGTRAGIKNASLAASAAENRARAEMVRYLKGAETTTKRSQGGTSESTVIRGQLDGAIVLDLYRSPKGQTYALLARAL